MSNDIVGKIVKGWAVGQTVTVPYKSGPKTLHMCTKTCRECGVLMRMNVARSALEGETKNNGLDYARCADCRAGRRKPVEEPAASAPVVAGQPQDLASQMYRDNVALLREIAELKTALALAERGSSAAASSTPNPVATPAQAPAPGTDAAELEALRKLRLDVFDASRCVEYGPLYVNAAGSKTRDRLAPEQVTNATLLAHVKEVGKLYTGVWRVFSGFEDAQVALNKVAYNQSYVSVARGTLDNSVCNRIDSEAQREADAEYPV